MGKKIIINLEQIIIIKITLRGETMSQHSHLKPWSVCKSQAHPRPSVTGGLILARSSLLHPGPNRCWELGLPCPTGLETEVFPKSEGRTNNYDSCFSWHCSIKHALGRWSPLMAMPSKLMWFGKPTLLFLQRTWLQRSDPRSWDSLWRQGWSPPAV